MGDFTGHPPNQKFVFLLYRLNKRFNTVQKMWRHIFLGLAQWFSFIQINVAVIIGTGVLNEREWKYLLLSSIPHIGNL